MSTQDSPDEGRPAPRWRSVHEIKYDEEIEKTTFERSGQRHLRQQRRLWIVTKSFTYGTRDWNMSPQLVLARSAPEARQLVREKFYEARRDVPHDLTAVEVDVTASRVLDEYDEEVRVLAAREVGGR